MRRIQSNRATPPSGRARFAETATRSRRAGFLLALFTAALMLSAPSVRAANILVNPSFEANSGHVIPQGWTYFMPPPPPNYFGNYWVESRPAQPHSGTLFWKQWGALYSGTVNNVAGIRQEFSSAPGSIYRAQGWLYTYGGDVMHPDCRAWVEVAFLDSSTNIIALFKSHVFAATDGTDMWHQLEITNVCDLASPVSLEDPYFTTYAVTGAVSQLVAPLGTAKVRYQYCYLQYRAQGGSCFLDDSLLDQVSGPRPPVISGLFPSDMIFVNPNEGLRFDASSPSGFNIENNGIGVLLNGVDVSANLNISGSSSNKHVVYQGLQSNTTYAVSITVTDSFHFTASTATYFETTWVGLPPVLYLWEAEDFDFDGGSFINNPVLCDTPGNPNCYFGKVGIEGVDEHSFGAGGSHLYRPDDAICTSVSGDFSRRDHALAGMQDYRIDPFIGDEWVNYTRDWTSGDYWVIARLSTDVGLAGTVTLSQVNPDTSTTDLGTFTIANGRGWSTYDNVYLKDTNGNIATITLNGRATLRATSGGNLLPNFFALVAGQADIPLLSNLYPAGTRPFEYTNALSFNVTSSGATLPADQIRLFLDGIDVSSNLVVSGTAATKSVLYPALQPNALHTAVITVTNSLDHGILVSYSFDTFDPNNYMVEAEDFDFDGGQFIADWTPECYFGLGATTNVDFQHASFAGERFVYRIDGIPEDLTRDSLRQRFIDVGARDYDLTWFGSGDWGNFTRVYPTNNFYVYGRFSGLGPYSMYLDKVVSGGGTTSQVTQRLGRWGAVGRAYNLYDWVPLTDDGLAAPALVRLGGLATLRLATDGNTNPNFFMLVPAFGITLTATRSGNDVVLTFPTQPGAAYRIFQRTSLVTGNWTLLRTVLGDGNPKSVSEPATGAQSFYQVVSP